jgi:hypothetical protein
MAVWAKKHTQILVCLEASKKIRMNAVQKPPNIEIKPRIRRMIRVGGIRFPSAFILKNPGNASRSIA